MEDIANNGEGKYMWRPGPSSMNFEKGWSVTIAIETTPHMFWWRKLKK